MLIRFNKPFLQYQPVAKANGDYEAIRERAFRDHEFFVREFFEHHFWGDMSAMHEYFCQLESIPDRRGSNEVTAAPRGNAKTTFRVLMKVIHAIVYGYHPFIIIIGYSKAEAIDKVKDIRDELLTNEHLIEVYGKLLSPKAAKSDFITTNKVRVTARSKGGQVRGLKYGQSRPSYIILDDIESLESVNTPEQRMKTKTWFYKDVMGSGRPDGKSDFEVVGTILHQEGLLAELLQKPGWKGRKYQAILSWAQNQTLWEEWKAIYCALENQNAREDALKFYEANEAAMLEGVEVLWPTGETYYQLMEYTIQFGLASLYSEKQNDPYDPERQILNPDICKRFKVIWAGDANWPKEFQEQGFVVDCEGKQYHSSQLKIIAFHDPALAETNKSDYASVCVCAQDPFGYVYVLESYIRRDPPAIQIRKALDLYSRWQVDTLYMEAVGFQELLKPLYHEELKSREGRFRIIGVDQHSNKIHRISTLEPYFSNGWLRLNQDTSPLLIDQLRLFPTTHDDGPDALQGCVERLKRPGGQIKVTNEGQFIR